MHRRCVCVRGGMLVLVCMGVCDVGDVVYLPQYLSASFPALLGVRRFDVEHLEMPAFVIRRRERFGRVCQWSHFSTFSERPNV